MRNDKLKNLANFGSVIFYGTLEYLDDIAIKKLTRYGSVSCSVGDIKGSLYFDSYGSRSGKMFV